MDIILIEITDVIKFLPLAQSSMNLSRFANFVILGMHLMLLEPVLNRKLIQDAAISRMEGALNAQMVSILV